MDGVGGLDSFGVFVSEKVALELDVRSPAGGSYGVLSRARGQRGRVEGQDWSCFSVRR
jgi:hypothetical protein